MKATVPFEMNRDRVLSAANYGHTKDGHGIQQHSAGALFPLVIVRQGNLWHWIDPIKRVASGGYSLQATVSMSGRMWLISPSRAAPASKVRENYPHRAGHYDRLHGLDS